MTNDSSLLGYPGTIMPAGIEIAVKMGSYGAFMEQTWAFEHLTALGVRWIEQRADVDLVQLGRALAAAPQLKVCSFIVRPDFTSSQVIDNFKRTCDTLLEFKPRYLMCLPRMDSDAASLQRGYETVRRMADIASERGCFLSLELHPPLCADTASIRASFAAINHPAVRLNFDTANLYYFNALPKGSELTLLEQVFDHVSSLHIKQSSGVSRRWWFPALDTPEGIIDFALFFHVLGQRKFRGWAVLELEGIAEHALNRMSREEITRDVERSVVRMQMIQP
jgi:sugar phosphate isomerase/epimerase